jgi:hypothetical protein
MASMFDTNNSPLQMALMQSMNQGNGQTPMNPQQWKQQVAENLVSHNSVNPKNPYAPAVQGVQNLAAALMMMHGGNPIQQNALAGNPAPTNPINLAATGASPAMDA